MKSLLAYALAVIYGLLMRFFFGFYAGLMQVMSLSLLALVPLAVGFLTVALNGINNAKSSWTAFFMPWLTSLLLLLITIALSMEGAICWIMIYPFFAVMAGVGGLLGRYYLLEREKRQNRKGESRALDDLDDWNKPGALKISALLLSPLLLGLVEGDRLLAPAAYTVERQITLDAPVSRVWDALASASDIAPLEDPGFLTGLFGLPRHLRTALDTLAVGGRRMAYYERGLFFEETITHCQPGAQLVVAIKADPDNIPPTVLDEHIAIGGRHFKALEDTYTLHTLPDGRCRLQLSGRISIQTPFNWYAGLWAQWVLGEVLEGVLEGVAMRVSSFEF